MARCCGERLALELAVGINVAVADFDRLVGKAHHALHVQGMGLVRPAERHDLPSPRRTEEKRGAIDQHAVAGQDAGFIDPISRIAAIGTDRRSVPPHLPPALQGKRCPQSAQTTSRCLPSRVSAIDPPLTWQPIGKPSRNQVRNTAAAVSSSDGQLDRRAKTCMDGGGFSVHTPGCA